MSRDPADEGERNAGAAAGVFDDAPARFQESASLCGLDHGKRHAVLHAPGRIGAFELDQEARAAVRSNAPERHERRAADALQDGRIDRWSAADPVVRAPAGIPKSLACTTLYVTTYTVANRRRLRQAAGRR